jgi:hypothetical protein
MFPTANLPEFNGLTPRIPPFFPSASETSVVEILFDFIKDIISS